MHSLILSLLFLVPTAHAADFCASLELLHGHVFFCEDNATYAKYADNCKEQFRALAQAKSVALQHTLTGDIAGAKGESQTTHFKTTQASYESTDLALAQAIDTGKHARGEVVSYGDDFVAPFSWPWMDLGAWPGLHHPKVQELFRTQGCYKDNIESIEHTTAELDQMIHDLETTRTITAQLHKRASGRELSLADLSGIPLIGSRAPGGHSQNSASDVTGTSRDKGRSLSGVAAGAKLKDPGFIASGTGRNLASDITGAGASQLRSASASPSRAPDSASLFTTNLNPVPSNGVSEAQGISVGSVLWASEAADSKSRLALAATAPVIAQGDVSSGVASQALFSDPQPQSLPALAGPDRDIFSLVHERYRATELFRAAPAKH